MFIILLFEQCDSFLYEQINITPLKEGQKVPLFAQFSVITLCQRASWKITLLLLLSFCLQHRLPIKSKMQDVKTFFPITLKHIDTLQ